MKRRLAAQSELWTAFKTLLLAFAFSFPGIATASMPDCASMQATPTAQASEMSAMPDCTQGEHGSKQAPEPGKAPAAGCMASAGCIVIPALNMTELAIASVAASSDNPAGLPAPPMRGRTDPPDLRPPAFLG